MVGNARNLAEALLQVETLHPNLVLVGPNLSEEESLSICRAVIKRWAGIKLVVFSAQVDDPLFEADAAHAGASACLLPTLGEEEYLSRIAGVMAGYQLFPREIFTLLYQPEELTSAEHAVLKFLVEGKTKAEIADALKVEVSTVASHQQRILEKLGVHTREEALRRARRRGMV